MGFEYFFAKLGRGHRTHVAILNAPSLDKIQHLQPVLTITVMAYHHLFCLLMATRLRVLPEGERSWMPATAFGWALGYLSTKAEMGRRRSCVSRPRTVPSMSNRHPWGFEEANDWLPSKGLWCAIIPYLYTKFSGRLTQRSQVTSSKRIPLWFLRVKLT